MRMSNEKPNAGTRRDSGFFGLVKRMARNEQGVTAVEFGMVALPFIVLIIALLETALVHMTTLDLENAVKDASRDIRTGQAQIEALSADQFKELVCDKVVLISLCETTPDLVIDVRSYEGFEGISMDPSDVYDEDGNFIGGENFSMGSALKVVVVRAYYRMELVAQMPEIGLANAGPHHRMINAMAVFRNEPF